MLSSSGFVKTGGLRKSRTIGPRDPGVKAPNGPWASQICAALKAEFHPRIEFFLALGRFNQVVADKELRNITDRKTKARLVDAKPLTDDSGKVYGAAEFFALMSGLSPAPEKYKEVEPEPVPNKLVEALEAMDQSEKDKAIAVLLKALRESGQA